MKKIILILSLIISLNYSVAQTGTIGDPFTSLNQAASITTAGIYYLNIDGSSFDTYIDANGYVQIAIDFGNGFGGLPQSTSLTTASRGILTPAVLATLTEIQEVRISSSTGNVDVTSYNASIISRIQSNITLHQGSIDNSINNDWIGTNANYLTNDASCGSPYGTSLHQNIFHPCGNANTFHWIPNTGVQREIHSSGEIANTTSLQIWVKGSICTSPITSLEEAALITTPGIYCFDISGVSFETYVDANGYVQIANDFGNGNGNLPQSNSLTTVSRGILIPSALATLSKIKEVKISSSTGGIDVISSNASIISRIQSNTILHQGVTDNGINDDWTGTNANYFTNDGSCDSPHGTSLHQNIFHPCGNASTFHWIPNTSVQREAYNSGEVANTTSLQLWVKGYTTVWDGGAGTNFWEDPLNWDGDVLPTSSDIVIIPDGNTIIVSAIGAVCEGLRIGDAADFEVMTTGEITIGDHLDLQSGASVNVIRGILNLRGDIINDGSASIVFSTNSTMNYNGNGTQTVANKNYYNLTLSGSGTKNLTGTVGVKNTFTNSATIGTNTGTIDYNGQTAQIITSFDYHNLTISGDKGSNSITFGSTIGIANSLSLTATNVTYDLSTNPNTINYNGSSPQNIGNITGGYHNLVCENSTKQFAGEIDVANDFIVNNTTIVQTAGNDLRIGGDFENNGTFTHSSSDIIYFYGTGQSEIRGNVTFKKLNVNKVNQSVTVNGDVSIDSQGAITIENGTSTLAVTGKLTLLSTGGMHTARITEIPAGSSVSGNVTIQRHIPITTNTFSWWHLTNSVKNVTVADWQSFFPISGKFVGKDSISGSVKNAKDNWSLKTFEESRLTSGGVFNDGWKGFPTSINTETFENGQGYRAYIVDKRTGSSVKKLSFTGEINQGDFEFSSLSNANMTYTNSGVANSEGYAFLGNPYPSAIDFAENNWTKTNVIDAMYIWDAEIKIWRGWSESTGAYNGGSSIIPTGQGFWVQATGTPTLTVRESAKVSNTVSLQRTTQVENNINVSLEVKGSDDLVTTDIRISDLATAGYDEEYDMAYLSRNLFSEFNSIPLLDIASETKDGKKVFINSLPISGEEIIPLHITTTIGNEHVLTVTKENYNLNSQVYLVDNVLNTEVLVEDVISYSFDSKLGTKDRFSVKIDNRIVLETEDFVENGQYNIYPNPATSKGFTVKGTQSYEDVTITVTDVLGNTVYNSTVENNESGFEKHVKFNNSLKAGVYVVKFTTSNNENIQKIIIE